MRCRQVWKIAFSVMMVAIMALNVFADERGNMCYSYALEANDFNGIPAEGSICTDVGLPCLTIDPAKEAALSVPIPYLEYDRRSAKLPAPPPVTYSRCLGPIFAFTEVKPEEAIDYDKLTYLQEQKIAALLPRVYDVEWNAERTHQHMSFQSPTDPDFTAEGLCTTEGSRYGHGPVHECAIYQFRKSGRVFQVNVVGSRWSKFWCPLEGGEDLTWVPKFGQIAAGRVVELFASSPFNSDIDLKGFGIRALGWHQGHAPLESERAMLELVFRSSHPSSKSGHLIWNSPSRSFSIQANTTAEICREATPRNWLWFRANPEVKAEWNGESQKLIKKIETAICRLYNFGRPTSESQSDASIVDKGSIDHSFECSGGPR